MTETTRTFATLATILLLLVAGCSSPPPTTTTTLTSGEGTLTATTTTPTPRTTLESTTTQATTTVESFDASVSFPNCTAVTVSAGAYSWVGIATESKAYNYRGNYSGEHTYTTERPIATVYVSSSTGSIEVDNPAYEDCVTPTPTTTARETTQAPTTTSTPTTTTVAPTTTTPTTTQVPTTTTRPEISRHEISTHVENTTLGRNASAVYVVTNWNEAAVTFHYDVYWMDDRNGGDDFMEDATRKTVTLEPGESVRLEYQYRGNVTIDSIRHSVNGLRYAD